MAQDGSRYHRNPDFIFRRIVDEAVLVPIHQNVADMECIYSLNGVAAFLWARLEAPATQAELLQAVLDEYAAGPEVVAADLGQFLQEMASIGAVRSI